MTSNNVSIWFVFLVPCFTGYLMSQGVNDRNDQFFTHKGYHKSNLQWYYTVYQKWHMLLMWKIAWFSGCAWVFNCLAIFLYANDYLPVAVTGSVDIETLNFLAGTPPDRTTVIIIKPNDSDPLYISLLNCTVKTRHNQYTAFKTLF